MAKASDRIQPILQRAEIDLREVMSQAALAGDYQNVDLAREIASRISGLMQFLVPSSIVESNGHPVVSPNKAHRPQKVGRATTTGKSYPRFVIRKDMLVKTGWSKKSKKEYVHKATRDAYDQTILAIEALATSGLSPFTAEQVVERTDPGGAPIPIYQVYVTLAYLREHGAIRRDGRDGYSVDKGFADRARALWNQKS
jgi:hypothetical protein